MALEDTATAASISRAQGLMGRRRVSAFAWPAKFSLSAMARSYGAATSLVLAAETSPPRVTFSRKPGA